MGRLLEKNFNQSLITSAHNISDVQNQNPVPSGWVFSDSGDLEVFEFSTDFSVHNAVAKIRNSSFLAEMHNLLVKSQMQDLFAVSILNRSALEHKDGYVYLEKNYDETKQSVVNLVSVNFNSDNIRTSWSFADAIQHRCLVTWYECVKEGPGHYIRGVHNDS